MSMTKHSTPVMPSSSSAAPPDPRRIDPRIWQACAGSTVWIPTVNSRVYYFPQGHLEQSFSASAPMLSSLIIGKPCIGCVISAVSFHADVATDEVFARIMLRPVEAVDRFSPADVRFDGAISEEEEKITSYAKILTASDANNGGGFSVPRSCADLIFPPLDFHDDPPVQTLVVSDIHGVSWSFRHIYRGTPRRHLLTTGWSKFVNSKKLVAGDTVLFMKNSYGNMFVGLRRVSRTDSGDYSNWRMQIDAANAKVDEDFTEKDGFTRNGRGRVHLESIVNSMEMAARGFPFEVIFYPRVGWPDFVVKADLVEAAMRMYWAPGLRVKMAVETDDSSRVTWFQGTVSSASLTDKGPWQGSPWQGSPWRSIQITWDEPEVMWNACYVNPWQVEVAMTNSPPFQSMFLPARRPRSASGRTDPPRFISGGEPPISHFSVTIYNNTSSPASMQGARQDARVASNFSNFFDVYTPPPSVLKTQSTGFNNGSSSENLPSPDSMSSGLSSTAIEVVQNQEPAPKVPRTSIKLFGETIYLHNPIDSASDETGCADDDDGSREMDLTLAGSYGELLQEA